MQNQATPNARKFARSLRREMTDGERLLWQRLRGEQLSVKFRRQHPVGSYVADFACLAPQLIVEIDGSQHVDQQAYDAKRDAYFKHLGFDVMRFPANMPFSDLQSMVQAIHNRLTELVAAAPIPTFPQRGKEPENSPVTHLLPQSAGLENSPAAPLPPRGVEPENFPARLLPPLGEGRDGGSPEPLPSSRRF